MILYSLILVLVLLLTLCMLGIAYDHIFVGKAPYKKIEIAAINEILTQLSLNSKVIFYDLGCGDGRVLIAACSIQPEGKYLGIEKAIIPYLTAKYKTRKYNNISIVRADITKYVRSTNKPTIIYMYLLPDFLKAMSPSLQNLPSKTQMVSVGWPIKGIKNTKAYKLKSRSKFVNTWYLHSN